METIIMGALTSDIKNFMIEAVYSARKLKTPITVELNGHIVRVRPEDDPKQLFTLYMIYVGTEVKTSPYNR